ncbi:MAG TPA: SOS response-associated peptidase [Vulgatibacter sp.]|nr:SOS response-associated peptidase [Vulgatibacter sp.]
MCGRYSLGVPSATDLATMLRARLRPEHEALFRPRYNVAPTQRSWVVREEEGRPTLAPAVWGFPSTTGKFLINARSETAATRPAFRGAWKERRCVVPTDGFFEWKGPPRDRRPLWFHPADGGLLLLAGLFQDGPEPRFVILTTAANEIVAPVHDRMPAILAEDEAEAWLADPPEEPLAPAPAHVLRARPVSPRVNSVANDDPECLAPPPPDEPGPGGQLRLL